MARIRKSPPKRAPRAGRKTLSATKATRELEELNRVGIALSETRDVEQLLDLILKKAREITAADAGSLYLVERAGVSAGDGLRVLQLRFKLTQNDSVQFPFSEHTLPLTEDSMAGYSALHGEVIELADAYRISKGRPFHFNATFDQEEREGRGSRRVAVDQLQAQCERAAGRFERGAPMGPHVSGVGGAARVVAGFASGGGL